MFQHSTVSPKQKQAKGKSLDYWLEYPFFRHWDSKFTVKNRQICSGGEGKIKNKCMD
jgi:hypothetical protein